MDELISRQAAIDAHCELCGDRGRCNCDICPDVEVFQLLPSAQPDLDEWCTDCKEYNQEKHCCPRWNRVIRETAEEVRKDAEPKWIPVTERLPERIGEYLCQESQGFQYCDTYLGSGKWRIADHYFGKVVAWMPLPRPYEKEEENA